MTKEDPRHQLWPHAHTQTSTNQTHTGRVHTYRCVNTHKYVNTHTHELVSSKFHVSILRLQRWRVCTLRVHPKLLSSHRLNAFENNLSNDSRGNPCLLPVLAGECHHPSGSQVSRVSGSNTSPSRFCLDLVLYPGLRTGGRLLVGLQATGTVVLVNSFCRIFQNSGSADVYQRHD